ncbi:leucine rich repeat LRR-containing protein [Nitzschia inconspicua]|uniref:Leucine rich repeat LRR-containing protein n=1 Tax=Nitzschia inconspicua TaxID=303405 RepID=A0A9K3Q5F8_9STRA|nr:leucine rich repeat LRR-containing protein [Nitzschia inconspicua]
MDQQLSYVCQRLKAHDETLSLLNLSCRGVGSEGVVKLAASCGYDDSKQYTNDDDDDNNNYGYPPRTTNSPLVTLWLEGNDIYPLGARALRNLLSVSPRLKYLYLSSNYIGNAGISALAPMAFRQCTVIHMSDNKINAVGAVSIAEALQHPESRVQTLLLDNNRLADEGMIKIAEALRHNTTLKHLDVKYNKIGEEGLMAIRSVLQTRENTTLEYFVFEEEQDNSAVGQQQQQCSACTRRIPTRRNRKMPRLMEKMNCSCDQCHLRHEIDFYLALNRAGRRKLADVSIRSNLWPRILSKVSHDDPSLLFTMLETRPDVPLRR